MKGLELGRGIYGELIEFENKNKRIRETKSCGVVGT